MSLELFSGLSFNDVLTFVVGLVNYLAYLRKMTRYNPTRGGTNDKSRGDMVHRHQHRLTGE